MKTLGRIVNGLEEGFIALVVAAMTLVTFVQVVLRRVFDTGFVWAPELTTCLFAWLVLFGASYGVKVNAHLGVDAFVRLFGTGTRRALGLVAVAAGLAYAAILFIGGWNHAVGFLYATGIGAEGLPIPRWLPTAILPVGLALLFLRLAQVGWRILTGRQEGMLPGDEAAAAVKRRLGDFAEGTGSAGGADHGRGAPRADAGPRRARP